MNRRSFLGASALALGAMTVFKGVVATAKEAAKKIKASQVFTDNDKITTVAEYCAHADKDMKKCPSRQKAEKKGQYCEGCQFYTEAGKDEKGEGVGKCLLIQKQGEKEFILGKGWCASWTKKQG
jgi:hypothetical protein